MSADIPLPKPILCRCGERAADPGSLCSKCIAALPPIPKSMQRSAIAGAIREAERALAQTVRSANHQAEEIAKLRRIYDALAIDERDETAADAAQRERAPESQRVPRI